MWDWTPRQARARADIAQNLLRNERAANLSIAALAARAKPEEIKKLIKEWSL